MVTLANFLLWFIVSVLIRAGLEKAILVGEDDANYPLMNLLAWVAALAGGFVALLVLT